MLTFLTRRHLLLTVQAAAYALLATPLLMGASFVYPYIAPKAFGLFATSAVLIAAWLLLAVRFPEYRPRRTPLLGALGALLGALLLSAVLGVDVARSFWSTEERQLGLLALLHLAGVFLALSTTTSPAGWLRYLRVSFWISVVTAAGGLWQRFAPFFFDATSAERPGSFFGNPSFLAAYLLFHVFFALWFARTSWVAPRGRAVATLYATAAAFFIAIIFLTQTRGALLGLAAGALALLVFYALRGPRTPLLGRVSGRELAAGFLLLLVLGTAGFWLTRSAPIWQSVPGARRLANLTLASTDIQPRLVVLRIAWQSFLERPLLGFGYENFKYPFDTRFEPELLRYGFSETYFDKPHNIFAEYAVVGGLVGLLAYLAVMLVAVRQLARHPHLIEFRPFGYAMIAAYAVQNFFLFDTYGGLLSWFMLLAFINTTPSGVLPEQPNRREHASTTPSLSWSALALLLALGVAGWVAMNGATLYANNRQYWGLNYFLNRDPAKALAAFRTSITIPGSAYADGARRDLGSAYAQMVNQGVEMPNLKETNAWVMGELTAAITHRPNDYFLRVSWADYATMLASVDRSFLPEANQQIEEAIRLSPRRQQNFYTLAKLQILGGRSDAALATMRRAIDLDPAVGEPHFYYGLIAFSAGRPAEAFAALAEAKRLGRAPLTFQEMVLVANQEGDAGNYSVAAELYERALKLRPDSLETELKLGLVYFFQDDYARAAPHVRRVAEQTDLTQSPAYGQLMPILRALGVEVR